MYLFIKKVFKIIFYFSALTTLCFSVLLGMKYDKTVDIIGQKNIDSAQILILGDSRAARQINPVIINKVTGINVLNIAESSMDLYSLTFRLKKLNVKDKLIIISASSWQMNDGATANGYFRMEAFNDLNGYRKIQLYSDNLIELKLMLSNSLFSNHNYSVGDKSRLINSGFKSLECREFDTVNMFENHPWYRNINLNGVKAELLKQALRELNTIDCKGIIIYNGPVSIDFASKAKYNGVWRMENEYSNTIARFIEKEELKRITFFDLRNLSGFNNNDYYDPQHFCEKGANKFTNRIIQIFNLNSSKFHFVK